MKKLILYILTRVFDIELWADIKGYEGLYQVSSHGEVRSFMSGKVLKAWKRKGYPSVNLYKDGIKTIFHVHRLVAEAFIPNAFNKPCVNHKTEQRDTNHVKDLEWCTAAYNNNYGTRVERCTKTRMENLYGTSDEEIVEKLRKEREKELQRASYERNRDYHLAYSKQYHQEHKEEVLEYKRKWQRENREEWNEYMRSYYAKNREKILEQRNKKG